MTLTRLRLGDLLALAGAVSVIVSLFVRWYDASAGAGLDAWDTFGPGVVLLLLATAFALALIATTLVERNVGAPVALAVWSVLLGLAAVIAAIVRLLERPDHATALAAGAWLAFAGALAVLAGAWLSMRDERTSLYAPATPPAQPPP
jgi:hypothetical protein